MKNSFSNSAPRRGAIHVAWIVLMAIGFFLAIVLFSYMNLNSAQNSDFQRLEAEKKVMQNVFDNTTKTITQQAQVSGKYADDVKELATAIMTGRYGDTKDRKAPLMNWIQEKNPEFSPSLYEKLSDSIEINRNKWSNAQQAAIAVQQSYETRRTDSWTKWALGGWPKSELQLVTSSKTEEAFTTGQENDIDLFEKKK